ncbi:hypothetical protein MJ524_28395 [Escherichia coli]|nr:hypothetical protein MJ524_28395 [Escherichia coli]
MPVIFTVFFLWFPSGLVLYYIVSNLVTIVKAAADLPWSGKNVACIAARREKNPDTR